MITAAAMLLSCMPYLTVAAEGEPITAASNLEISTVDGLEAFRDAVNTGITYEGYTVSLEANIDLNSEAWTPIGVYSGSKPFMGTFNGKGHTISGLKITTGDNVGLFGYVSGGGTIKNLEVSGEISASGNAGGIVAYLNESNSTVSCCHSDVTITGTGNDSSAVGGIVGMNVNGTVENCYNTGSITAWYNVGGIVGKSDIGTIEYCHNQSRVSISTGSTGHDVGAIIGSSNNDKTITSCRFLAGSATNGIGDKASDEVKELPADDFKDSYNISTNFPDWNFTDTWKMGNDYPVFSEKTPYAGFTNHITSIEQLEMLRDVVNDGKLDNYEYSTYYLDNDLNLTGIDWKPIGTADHPFTKIFTGWDPDTNKEAVRTITGLKIDTSSDNQGLFGYNSGGTIKNLTLSKCNVSGGTNVGCLVGQNNGTIQNVTVDGTVTGSGNNVGGIVGYNEKGTVTRCHTETDSSVKGQVNIGGIAGKNGGTVELSYNTGEVGGNNAESNNINIGGVVGSNSGVSSVLQNSYNTGNVSATSIVGGVIGINEGSVINCYSKGTVSKSETGDTIGGVAGNNNGGNITSCYCLDTTASNIIGNGSIYSNSKVLDSDKFIDETNFVGWDFNNQSIWTISNSAKAPVFFNLTLTREAKDIATGYYTDANRKRHDVATAFVVTLNCGDVETTPYVSGSVSVNGEEKTYIGRLATRISQTDVIIGVVLTGIAAENVLKAQAMIE